MAGLDPAIRVDPRAKPGDDENEPALHTSALLSCPHRGAEKKRRIKGRTP